MLIIVTGKGGVGKTTLMGVLARYLQSEGREFAVVDADPVGALGQLLAAPAGATIAELAARPQEDTSAAEPEWAHQLAALLAPLPDGGQLVRMGHPVHNGCFCRVNALAQATINALVARFPVVLVDNEAGVEHLTRGVGRYVTRMVLLADLSHAALQVAGDALSTTRALNAEHDNRLQGTAHLLIRLGAQPLNDAARDLIQQRVQEQNLPRPRFLPDDPRIALTHFRGEALPAYNGVAWSPLYRAVDNWIQTEDLLTVW